MLKSKTMLRFSSLSRLSKCSRCSSLMLWDRSWSCAWWSFKICRNSRKSLSSCLMNCGSNRSILNTPSSNTTSLTPSKKRESNLMTTSIMSFKMSASSVRKLLILRPSVKLSYKKSCSQKWTTTKERRTLRRPIRRSKKSWTHWWWISKFWLSIVSTISSIRNASRIGSKSLQIVLFAKKVSTLSRLKNSGRIKLFIKSEFKGKSTLSYGIKNECLFSTF